MIIIMYFLFYSLGSKKSAPIRMVKEACVAVEALDGIPVKNSSINASVNMESLCCELERQPNLIQVIILYYLIILNTVVLVMGRASRIFGYFRKYSY